MTPASRFTPALAALSLITASLAGCAGTPAPDPQARATRACVKVTGSNICRAEGEASVGAVHSVPGEALRRGSGELLDPRASAITQ